MNLDYKANQKPNFTYIVDANTTRWNHTDYFYNATNSSDTEYFDYDYQKLNRTVEDESRAGMCKEWNPAQHDLFQTANFFFAAAFLVPGSFKQSVLVVR